MKLYDIKLPNEQKVTITRWETDEIALEALKEVKNLNRTGNLKCSCGSWIEHWENETNKTRGQCSRSGCSNTATDGAHVKKVNSTDNKSYIIPLCRSCNIGVKGSFSTKSGTKTAWANASKTCGKKGKNK